MGATPLNFVAGKEVKLKPISNSTFVRVYRSGSNHFARFYTYACLFEFESESSPAEVRTSKFEDRPTVLLKTSPNPFKSHLVVDLSPPNESDGRNELALFELSGKKIGILVQDIVAGNESQRFNFVTDELPPGIYFLRFSGTGFNKTVKIIKI